MVWTPAQTKSKLFLPGTNHVKYIEKKQQFMESFLTSLRIEHYEGENVSHQSDAGNSQQHHSLHQEGDVVQPRSFFKIWHFEYLKDLCIYIILIIISNLREQNNSLVKDMVGGGNILIARTSSLSCTFPLCKLTTNWDLKSWRTDWSKEDRMFINKKQQAVHFHELLYSLN